MGYPDYNAINRKRQQRFLKWSKNPHLIASAIAHYRNNPVDFICDWGITYDPRNAGTGRPTVMPFVLFDRQKKLVHFFRECLESGETGVVEKCRDAGVTWVGSNFSVWAWRFVPGSSIGWGSRKEMLVDRLGDPDSIFEKLRMTIYNLPSFLKPPGYNPREHSAYMKLINPDNDSTITGEAGDNIGRGGRKSIYFVDESAHLQRAEMVDASLGDNTNCQIHISSVNGPTTVFQRKRNSGEIWTPEKDIPKGVNRVFIFDWRDHPLKDQEWYNRRKAKAEREGLLHLFAQEVDRDTTASVKGTIIPAAWIYAARDAHKKLGIKPTGETIISMDVADSNAKTADSNALAARKGILLKECIEWKDEDAGVASQKAFSMCKRLEANRFQYDPIGVGASVKSEINRLKRNGLWPKSIEIVPWNAGDGPLHPNRRIIRGDKETPRNEDFFVNIKAQGWWSLRNRFHRTYQMITGAATYDVDELISLSSEIEEFDKLVEELAQPTYHHNDAGKMIVNKTPEGSKSPNRADAVMMSYHPINRRKVLI